MQELGAALSVFHDLRVGFSLVSPVASPVEVTRRRFVASIYSSPSFNAVGTVGSFRFLASVVPESVVDISQQFRWMFL
jgi:hypothetical protein